MGSSVNRYALIVGGALVAASASAAADPADALCRSVENAVNVLVDFTNTKCIVTAGSVKGRNSLILLSEKPVLSSEKSKKAWMVVACAAVGSELNKRPTVVADELWFADVERVKQRVAFAVPAATCKSLQSKMHAGSVSIDQMYSSLSTQLVSKKTGE